MIYLDWNATTPPAREVIDEMRRVQETAWANPASVHGEGRRARAHVERAREAIAALVGLDARDVVLTSGGTEANNLALGHAFADRASGSLVLSRIEHPSIVRAAEQLAERGVVVEWAAVDGSGRVEPAALAEACARASRLAPLRLVALAAVNHETGVIQPVAEIAEIAHARGAKLHCDAVQAIGRLLASAWEGADLVAVAAHKIRGPKGVGALVTRPGTRLRPVLVGGAQERGIRPGTQDPAACAGFAVACERARESPARYAALAPLRDGFEAALITLGARFGKRPLRNGDALRAPHVSNLSWPTWRGDELCAALDLEGVAVSAGSACSAGTADLSPVLIAMLGEARARGAVRVSLGEESTPADLAIARLAWERVLGRG